MRFVSVLILVPMFLVVLVLVLCVACPPVVVRTEAGRIGTRGVHVVPSPAGEMSFVASGEPWPIGWLLDGASDRRVKLFGVPVTEAAVRRLRAKLGPEHEALIDALREEIARVEEALGAKQSSKNAAEAAFKR